MKQITQKTKKLQMKNYLLFYFCFIFCIACSSKKETIKNMKNEIVYEYYPSGKIQQKSFYLNGKRHGLTEKYLQNGILYWKTNYFEDKLNGRWTWFEYKNGVNYIEKIDYYTMGFLTKSVVYGTAKEDFHNFKTIVYTETYDSAKNLLKKEWESWTDDVNFTLSLKPTIINNSKLSVKIKTSPILYENTIIFLERIYSLSNNAYIEEIPDKLRNLTYMERDALCLKNNCIVRRDTIHMYSRLDTIVKLPTIKDDSKYIRKTMILAINFNKDTTDCHRSNYVCD